MTKKKWQGIHGKGKTLWEALCDESDGYRGCGGRIYRYQEAEAEHYEKEAQKGGDSWEHFHDWLTHKDPSKKNTRDKVEQLRSEWAWGEASEREFDWFDHDDDAEVALAFGIVKLKDHKDYDRLSACCDLRNARAEAKGWDDPEVKQLSKQAHDLEQRMAQELLDGLVDEWECSVCGDFQEGNYLFRCADCEHPWCDNCLPNPVTLKLLGELECGYCGEKNSFHTTELDAIPDDVSERKQTHLRIGPDGRVEGRAVVLGRPQRGLVRVAAYPLSEDDKARPTIVTSDKAQVVKAVSSDEAADSIVQDDGTLRGPVARVGTTQHGRAVRVLVFEGDKPVAVQEVPKSRFKPAGRRWVEPRETPLPPVLLVQGNGAARAAMIEVIP